MSERRGMRPASARPIQVQVLIRVDGTDMRGEYRYAFFRIQFPIHHLVESILSRLIG